MSRRQGDGVRRSTFVLDTHDGVPVVVHRWDTPAVVRGIVTIAHGVSEHARRYDRFAVSLAEAGFAVYAPDHRGHGLTAETPQDLGFLAPVRGWAKVVDDLRRVILRARVEHRDRPVFLFGHSMGALLAQQYLFRHPYHLAGLLLSGADRPGGLLAEVGAPVAALERRRLGPRGRSPLLASMLFGAYNRRFAPNRTDFDWLSRDTAEVDAYIADPLCGFVPTTQLFVDLAAGSRLLASADPVQAGAPRGLPIHLVAGSEDPVGGARGVAALAARYEAIGFTDVGSRLYDGARHELLHEINRDEVIDDVREWLDARCLTHDGRTSP